MRLDISHELSADDSHEITSLTTFTLNICTAVCPSICPSYSSSLSAWSPLSNLKLFDGFYSNSVYTCISRVSGLGLLMDKFHQFVTELSAHHTFVLSFSDNNLSYCQWISPNLVYALILWRSCVRLLMGKFHIFSLSLGEDKKK